MDDESVKHGALVRRGRLIDPAQNLDSEADLRFRAGIVTAIGELKPEPGERVIEADGLIVAPGFVDVHVHLREPGQEWKESIGTGSAAAAAGGFTTIFCMPNTEPALDSVVRLEELARRTSRDASVRVHPIATITEGRRGRQAVDYDALARAGAVGYSDDGESTRDAKIIVEALRASRRLGRAVMVHCEEPTLRGGAMHQGDISQELGIEGIGAVAEELIIDRDIHLARMTGGWLHVCHVSTGRGAESVAGAKRLGVQVTAVVMPHHLVMTDSWVAGRREWASANRPPDPAGTAGHPDTKVNPPLRPASDARMLLDSLKIGTLDILATDHAPHAAPENEGTSFVAAAFGINGSELALPTMIELVDAGHLNLSQVVSLFSTKPARLRGLNAGTLRPGSPADIVVFDPHEQWMVDSETMRSRSTNTPLKGMKMKGRVKLTMVGGDERYRD